MNFFVLYAYHFLCLQRQCAHETAKKFIEEKIREVTNVEKVIGKLIRDRQVPALVDFFRLCLLLTGSEFCLHCKQRSRTRTKKICCFLNGPLLIQPRKQ